MDKYDQLVSEGADVYIAALEEIGWFTDTEAKDKLKKKLSKEKEAKHFVLALADMSVDTEGFEDEASYQNLLKDLLKVAEINNWQCTVRYKNENTLLHVLIKTPKHNYTYDIDPEETFGWLDAAFIEDFINDEVLHGEGIESRFFDIPAVDQSAQYIFVSEKLHNKAVKKGIIPEDLDYFIDFGEE